MNFKNIILLISLLIFFGCNQYNPKKSTNLDFKTEKRYKNTGFSLIYKENLKLKKLDQRSLEIFHKTLKSRSLVKLTNPLNNKSLNHDKFL